MGLKVIHLLFIVASVCLTLLVGAWSFGVMSPAMENSPVLGSINLVFAFFLALYGITFWRKMRGIS